MRGESRPARNATLRERPTATRRARVLTFLDRLFRKVGQRSATHQSQSHCGERHLADAAARQRAPSVYSVTLTSVFSRSERDGFSTTDSPALSPLSTRARSSFVTTTSTRRRETRDLLSTTQANAWPFSSAKAALGTKRYDWLAFSFLRARSGRK